jgi:predicted Zn finger-like uncharacterized protein
MNKQEEYKQKLLKDNNVCPHCGSNNITADSFDGNGIEVRCESCDCSWFEEYKMVNIINIEIPEG